MCVGGGGGGISSGYKYTINLLFKISVCCSEYRIKIDFSVTPQLSLSLLNCNR